MNNLTQRNQVTADRLSQLSEQMKELEAQMKALNTEIRIAGQRQKAQTKLAGEFSNTLKQLKGLMKDACSVYGEPEALQDMLSDIADVVDEVTEDFDQYAQSNRFLNSEEAKEQDMEDVWEQEEQEQELKAIEASTGQGSVKALPAKSNNSTKKELELFWKMQDNTIKLMVKQAIGMPDDITTIRKIANWLSDNGYTTFSLEEIFFSVNEQFKAISSQVNLS